MSQKSNARFIELCDSVDIRHALQVNALALIPGHNSTKAAKIPLESLDATCCIIEKLG